MGGFDHFPDAAAAVATVVVVCLIGVTVAGFIPNLKATSRDLSFMVTGICVPSLLFSKLAVAFTPDMLSIPTVTLLLFGLLSSIVGGVVGYICGLITMRDRNLATLTLIGSAFQNTITLPLSLVATLNVPWLKGDVMDKAVAYVFIYSVMTAVIIAVFGGEIVRRAGMRMRGVKPPPSAPTFWGRFWHNLDMTLRGVWRPPLIGTVLGCACGLCGVTRTTGILLYPGTAFVNAAGVIGTCTVPLSLMLLGINMRANLAKAKGAINDVNNEITPRQLQLLTFCTIFTKLLVVPASVVLFFHYGVREVYPGVALDSALMLVLFMEASAPTALSATLLIVVNNFKPSAFARAVMFQYIAVIFSSFFWLTFTVWYVQTTTIEIKRTWTFNVD